MQAKRGFHVKVEPFGWGIIVNTTEDGIATVELQWFLAQNTPAKCFSQIENFSKFSAAAIGSFVKTKYGNGILIDFRSGDECHIVRLWAKRGPGSAIAYLRKEDILGCTTLAAGFECETPYGHGLLIQQCERPALEYSDVWEVNLPYGTGYLQQDIISTPTLKLTPVIEIMLDETKRNLGSKRKLGQKLLDKGLEKVDFLTEEFAVKEDSPFHTLFSMIEETRAKLGKIIEQGGVSAVLELKDSLGTLFMDAKLKVEKAIEERGYLEQLKKSGGIEAVLQSFLQEGREYFEKVSDSIKEKEGSLEEVINEMLEIAKEDDDIRKILVEIETRSLQLQRAQEKMRKSRTAVTLETGLASLQRRLDSLITDELKKKGDEIQEKFQKKNAAIVEKAFEIFAKTQSRLEAKAKEENLEANIEHQAMEMIQSIEKGGNFEAGIWKALLLQDGVSQLEKGMQILFEQQRALEIEKGFLSVGHMYPALLVGRLKRGVLLQEFGSALKTTSKEGMDVMNQIKLKGASLNRIQKLLIDLAEGKSTLEDTIQSAIDSLDDEEIVSEAKQMIEDWEVALVNFEKWQKDPRIKAVIKRIIESGIEDEILQSIEDIDPDELINEAEEAIVDISAREKLINKWKDQALEFLLQYLPDMPIEDVAGEYKKVGYTIGNLEMSNFKLVKEDVVVKLGDFATRKGDDLLLITAKNITAEFKRLSWKYNQKVFPFLTGEGVARAFVKNASIKLGFTLKRYKDKEGVEKPLLLLVSKSIEMEELELTIDGSKLSWVYNLLIFLFSNTVKTYICLTLQNEISDNANALLEKLNSFAEDSWPMILKFAQTEIDQLEEATEEEFIELTQRISEEEKAALAEGIHPDLVTDRYEDVKLIFNDEGPLGLILDLEDSKKAVYISSILGGTQAAKAVEQSQRSMNDLLCSQVLAINGMRVIGKSPGEVKELMQTANRPLTIVCRCFDSTKVIQERENEKSQGPAPSSSVEESPFHILDLSDLYPNDPLRRYMVIFLGSVALKLKAHQTILGCAEISKIGNSIEADGRISTGHILVGGNGELMLGRELPEIMRSLQSMGIPLELQFCQNPDFEIEFSSKPLQLKFTLVEGVLVVQEFIPDLGALAKTGLLHEGDVLISLNGVMLPDKGYSGDLKMIQGIENYPLEFVFERTASSEIKETEKITVTIQEPGVLGIMLDCGADGRPYIDRVLGLESASIRPGLVLLQIAGQSTAGLTPPMCDEVFDTYELPLKLQFRDMEMYSELRNIMSSR